MSQQKIAGIKKVLLVDDETMSLLFLETMLGVNGIEMLIAHSAEEAKNIIRQNRISFITTDLRMPYEDGFALIRWCMENNPEIPIVIYSATTNLSRDLVDSFPSVRAYFSKPIKNEELAQLLQWMRDSLVPD
jgi:DNA-binding NtrC family response regulator